MNRMMKGRRASMKILYYIKSWYLGLEVTTSFRECFFFLYINVGMDNERGSFLPLICRLFLCVFTLPNSKYLHNKTYKFRDFWVSICKTIICKTRMAIASSILIKRTSLAFIFREKWCSIIFVICKPFFAFYI